MEHGTSRCNEYTVYNEGQAYPEYLIEYVQDPTGWFYQITSRSSSRWYPFSPT